MKKGKRGVDNNLGVGYLSIASNYFLSDLVNTPQNSAIHPILKG